MLKFSHKQIKNRRCDKGIMCNLGVKSVLCILLSAFCDASDIFHSGSKTTFLPDSVSDYFGYTVVLSSSGFLVGAPKASSRVKKGISPGLVFNCRLSNLDVANVTCFPMGMDDDGRGVSIRRVVTVNDFFRDDMWFGATVATFPNGKLLVCAPRWIYPYKDNHLLASGACYVETKKRGMTLTPLKDPYKLAYKTDGRRREYGEYGTHLNFYAYGQAGMSVKVTGNNSIIIGAPGLMQWTGGIIDYKYSPDSNSVFFDKQPTSNPYFTKELGPDDYFGYSVESGVFEVNGRVLYVAGAPRSRMGFGQVLIFEPAVRELDPLKTRAKVRGPQLGSYFGASLCCADINGDGRSDLMVGAPNFVRKDGGLPYDQGAVFVYLAVVKGTGFVLEEAGYMMGSGESGARFGSTIADLGDVDEDGFNDVAVAAPWENDGVGVVYIYKGSKKGLVSQYAQRIIAEGSSGFGISISKGLDIDGNNCNDLAVGAHNSGTAYIYRCIPTMEVHAAIKVPDAMNLPQNASNFTVLFCLTVPPKKLWPHVQIDLKATIIIDPEGNRAMISGDPEYTVTAKPGFDVCDEQIVEVKSTADLSKPISIKLGLEPIGQLTADSTSFQQKAARLSENSTLNTSFLIQLVRDCGDDMICTPWLVMTLESLTSVYVPGTEDRLGVKLKVLNEEEPAYGAKVHLKLPSQPKRVPVSCSLTGLDMLCEVPAPLQRGESVDWEINLEYQLNATNEKVLMIVAELEDALYSRNISDETVKEVSINILPMANFSISGKALPNTTVSVTREKFSEAGIISFVHYFEVTNYGPSDWPQLDVVFEIPENVTLSSPLTGCEENKEKYQFICTWSVSAQVSLPVVIPLRFDLNKHGQLLEDQTFLNVTTIIKLSMRDDKKMATVSTVLVLDPAPPVWPLIVGSVAGLLVLAAIVFALYKYGFFLRTRRDELKRLLEETQPELFNEPNDLEPATPGSSFTCPASTDGDESMQELLSEDSD